MKSCPNVMNPGPRWWRPRVRSLSALAALFSTALGAEGLARVALWDTATPFADAVETEHQTSWKPVPANAFILENDPLKASSDPGYYGRAYAFKGDAVVENPRLIAAVWSSRGRVMLFPKAPAELAGGADLSPRQAVAIEPLQSGSGAATVDHIEVVRNLGDEVVLDLVFAVRGATNVSAVLSFGRNELVEIRPGPGLKGLRISSAIAYGVVPSFVGDDLIVGPSDAPSTKSLRVPAENLFLGLLQGETEMLVLTWPKGDQRLNLRRGESSAGSRLIESVDFDTDGHEVCLAVLAAGGIWHRQELGSAYLEKDVAIDWKRPFTARWKTQLPENGVTTTFAFRDSRGQVWRGVPGSYTYPVWFDGDKAFYHLSKKVPPKSESIVYFEEGQDTPPAILTPAEILQASVGRELAGRILDPAGRRLRTHHRRGALGVRRACTCGCTEAIQAVFEAGTEVEQKQYVEGAVDDMRYFVTHHVERINEYMRFAREMTQFLQSQTSASPGLKSYLDGLARTIARIPQEYDVQKENMKSLAYADDLARETVALTVRKDANNLKAYLDLGTAWRAMGGAQDYVLALCHSVTRQLFQEASSGCLALPEALPVALAIRDRCRQCLRNPDGYEIWPNY